jgi:hypothetical protein
VVSASFGFPHYQIYPGATVPEPGFESRRLYTGHHVANKQVSATLILGVTGAPVLMSSKLVSMRPQRFTFVRLSNPYMTCLITPFDRNVHHRSVSD